MKSQEDNRSSQSPRPSSRSSFDTRQSNYTKSLPPDSVLFAPLYQEEQLGNLYNKLLESSPEVNLLKEKLLEKAKNTLNTTSLPDVSNIVPFFHFDEFNDVHLAFLQHSPPYSPWFSIIETYFGPSTLDLHRNVYAILLEHQRPKKVVSNFTDTKSDDYDHIIEVGYNDEFHPTYSIKARRISKAKRNDHFNSHNRSSQTNNSRAVKYKSVELQTEEPKTQPNESKWKNSDIDALMDHCEENIDDATIEALSFSDQSALGTVDPSPSASTALSDPNWQEKSSSATQHDHCDPSSNSSSNETNSHKGGVQPRENSTKKGRLICTYSLHKRPFVTENNYESKRRSSSRPLRYSDFIPL